MLNRISPQTRKKIRNLIIILCCIALASGTALVYTIGVSGLKSEIHGLHFIVRFLRLLRDSSMFRVRYVFILLFWGYVGIHFLVDVRKMYLGIFRYRWVVAGIILLLMTTFKIHGDSMAMYNQYVQPGMGSEFAEPVFGQARPIRSDEWVVDTPAVLSAQYGDHPFGKYNEVLRGGNTLNLISGINVSYASFAKNPSGIVYKFLGVERGFCFCWGFRILFTYLITIELCYVITNKKKIIAVLGGTSLTISSFYLWWGFPMFIAGFSAAMVCIHYFLEHKVKWKKFLFAMGVALATANFVVNLYPAWQVPMAYVIIAFLIWFIHDYWKKIKDLDKVDWGMFAIALIFCGSMVISYLMGTREYTEAIMNTVYPGHRVDYGGFALNKLMQYGYCLFYPFKDLANASEAGVFYSLFPLPMVLVGIHQILAKKKDWLSCGLLVVGLFEMIYAWTGFPEFLAKITLMSYSMPSRLVDIIGLINVLFIVIILGRQEERRFCFPVFGIIISVGLGICAIKVSDQFYPEYLTKKMAVVSLLLITVFALILLMRLSKKWENMIIAGLIIVFLVSGWNVRPVMMGFDAFYSKPLSAEIQKITDKEDTTWLAVSQDIVFQGFAVACGAPTLNSVNTYPNLDMWKKIDPDGMYNDIYNRYAHITISMTEEPTTMELIQEDWVHVKLSFGDLENLGVDYILSREDLTTNDSTVRLNKMYEENGAYIYKITYH